ncbi:hypothetical protein M5689_002581 [Euphorbia peplus]|nr:hypothetical protein M5689_002581 [Euphorbia peplus]
MKIVCKEWYAMIEDCKFIKKQMHRGKCFSIFYTDNALGLLDSPRVSGLLSDTYLTLSDCNGLLLQQTLVSSNYVIRNPTTRRILDLPNPHQGILGMSLAHVKSTDEYKTVSLYAKPDEPSGEGCEVLTIGDHGDLTWKQLRMPGLIEADSVTRNRVIVTTSKAVHFVKLLKSPFIQVHSLDLATDTFTSSMVPTRFLSSLDNVRAFKAGGLLAIGTIDVKKKNLHILMLQDHKESKWAESLIVYPLNCLSSRDVKRATPFFIRKGRLWLWIAGKKFVGYNTMTKTVFRTDVAPKGRSIANRVQFNSSTLVLLRGMREDIDTSL